MKKNEKMKTDIGRAQVDMRKEHNTKMGHLCSISS